MARRAGRRRAYTRRSGGRRYGRRKDKRVPILATAGFIATGMDAVGKNLIDYMQGEKTFTLALNNSVTGLTGVRYDATGSGFDGTLLVKTWTPAAIGVAGSWLGSKLGANRQLRKIPLIGKYIKA